MEEHEFECGEGLAWFVDFMLTDASYSITRAWDNYSSNYDIFASADLKAMSKLCSEVYGPERTYTSFSTCSSPDSNTARSQRKGRCRIGLVGLILI